MAEISPLRRRMIEDMTVRNLSPATQRSYLAAVSKLSRYFGRSPDRLGLEDVRTPSRFIWWRSGCPGRRAVEKTLAGGPDVIFKVSDASADRGFLYPQREASLSEATLLGRCHEVAEMTHLDSVVTLRDLTVHELADPHRFDCNRDGPLLYSRDGGAHHEALGAAVRC